MNDEFIKNFIEGQSRKEAYLSMKKVVVSLFDDNHDVLKLSNRENLALTKGIMESIRGSVFNHCIAIWFEEWLEKKDKEKKKERNWLSRFMWT
jgi:hypothetical protein